MRYGLDIRYAFSNSPIFGYRRYVRYDGEVSRAAMYRPQRLAITISHTRSSRWLTDFNVLFLRNRYYLCRYIIVADRFALGINSEGSSVNLVIAHRSRYL